jgi:hypothetical protein
MVAMVSDTRCAAVARRARLGVVSGVAHGAALDRTHEPDDVAA